MENWKLFNCFLYFYPINFILNMQGATVPLHRATDEKQAQKALGKAKKKKKKGSCATFKDAGLECARNSDSMLCAHHPNF